MRQLNEVVAERTPNVAVVISTAMVVAWLQLSLPLVLVVNPG